MPPKPHGAEQLRQNLVTRFSRRIPAADIQRLADQGVLQIDDFRRIQSEGRMIPRKILSREQLARVPGLVRVLDLAPKAALTAAAVLAVDWLYRRYPKEPDGIDAWSRKLARLL